MSDTAIALALFFTAFSPVIVFAIGNTVLALRGEA